MFNIILYIITSLSTVTHITRRSHNFIWFVDQAQNQNKFTRTHRVGGNLE